MDSFNLYQSKIHAVWKRRYLYSLLPISLGKVETGHLALAPNRHLCIVHC